MLSGMCDAIYDKVSFWFIKSLPLRFSRWSSLRWMPVRRSGRGEVMPCWPEVGWWSLRLCVRRRMSRTPASEPRYLSVSVQRESWVVHAAGQEVQPKHLQVGVKSSQESIPATGFEPKWLSGLFISGIHTVGVCQLNSREPYLIKENS